MVLVVIVDCEFVFLEMEEELKRKKNEKSFFH